MGVAVVKLCKLKGLYCYSAEEKSVVHHEKTSNYFSRIAP
jgi:hypothetical protein